MGPRSPGHHDMSHGISPPHDLLLRDILELFTSGKPWHPWSHICPFCITAHPWKQPPGISRTTNHFFTFGALISHTYQAVKTNTKPNTCTAIQHVRADIPNLRATSYTHFQLPHFVHLKISVSSLTLRSGNEQTDEDTEGLK